MATSNKTMWGDEGHIETVIKEATCPAKVRLLQSCDKSWFERVMEVQIDIVGGKSLFNKMHKGMATGKFLSHFDPYFIQEQCDLYEYRYDFTEERLDVPGVYFFSIIISNVL